MQNYCNMFALAVTLNILLAAGLAFLWWRSYPAKAQGEAPQQSAGKLSTQPKEGQTAGPPASTETPRAPVQLTAQRLQSIGVKTDLIEAKSVEDQIRTVGNVEVDETRLSYVQVRFPGWIQKVFANSTYQYVRRGQP